MKRFLMLFMLLLPLGLMAQVDDMYFVPKKKKSQKVEEKEVQEFAVAQERVVLSLPKERDEDEYNRRPGTSVPEAEYYTDEADEYNDAETQKAEEDVEYIYSSRIVRFHNPRRVIVSSPWYWDVVYTSGVDNWVLYDDGIYWELSPVYDPWYTAWSWGGWGWSFAHCGWWGFHYYPYHWGYNWGYHHHHHFYPHWGGGFHNNHFAGGGHHSGRVPSISNLRNGGNSIARGTAIDSRSGARRGELSRGDFAQSNNRGVSIGQNRSSRGIGRVVERVTSVRRGADSKGTINRSNYRGVDGEQRQSSNKRVVRESSDKEKNYDRPSSTRNTSRSSNMERSSSSGRSNNSSFSSDRSRSSGSSFSRGGIGGGSRSSGGARGGGRR